MTRTTTIGAGIEGYYRLHARVYDRTRWAFLFGRRDIVRLAAKTVQPTRILEIGCGTGYNLALLQTLFPRAQIHGLDLSADMLQVARQRLGKTVTLWQRAYDQPLTRDPNESGYDLILASYALSMFNPGWDTAIDNMCQDLRPNGRIAMVDFHASRSRVFRNWMAMNHVRMEGQLLPRLDSCLQRQHVELRHAYAGLWQYCLYIGQPRKPS